ncbi:unnamed protein product [Brachionus calyciflorus]|uniref:ascorbate ferrireductase (transmembrane) n=1 Tax=Brachionus calyciflorus TaxID=104777 RepID=A0A814B4P5_9BILA|nr:unnamed protein product [Brachionus calyciflorus]
MANDYARTKAHACLMTFAWLFLVPNGIILARYYKKLLPSLRILNVDFWFNGHRVLMISTFVLSIVAFFLVLSDHGWKWVEPEEKTAFAHSIFGIVIIGIIIFQIIIGFVRPKKDSSFRKLFNWFHRSVGMICLILAIVTIYLGVCIDDMGLKNVGWGVVLGWSLWLIIFIALMEIVQNYNKNKNQYEYPPEQLDNHNSRYSMVDGVKIWLLVLHLIASLAFVVALITLIGLSKKEEKN